MRPLSLRDDPRVFTINLVYQVKQIGLNPLQLVLVGTTLELTAFLTEIPTGVWWLMSTAVVYL